MFFKITLKVVTNEKLANYRYWSQAAVIDVLFSFYLAAIF
jgi:hypothetical protein